MTEIKAWAAEGPGQPLVPFSFDPGPLGPEEVEIAVEHCGICHSDLSMLNNDWGMTRFPLVAGHEAVGRITALGGQAKGLAPGQRVGIGWMSGSCGYCRQCRSGDDNLCAAGSWTIVGRHGGFAQRLRADWRWALPLPEALDPTTAGPLLCGGVTVFSPILHHAAPTDRIGVVGIGGLGHMAVGFARAWGCHVTAFTSSPSKHDEAIKLGAHRVVATGDAQALQAIAGSIDLLLVTANVTLDWAALIGALAPNGRLHVVGAVLEPIPVPALALIMGQRSISGSPVGSADVTLTMLDFAARHGIAPQVERFPMSRVNDALAHLEAGKARYRIILDADFT